MTEKEIREILRELCDELDRGARRMVRDGMRKVVLPSMLGAGLALSAGGCSDRAAPAGDQKVSRADAVDAGLDKKVTWPETAYGVRDMGPMRDSRPKVDTGAVVPPYMAPDIGPKPMYMPPFPPDGLVPPTPDYMAPFDGGISPLYAVPMYSVPAPSKDR